MHVAHDRNEKCEQNFGSKVSGKDHSEDLGIGGRINMTLGET